MKQKRNIEYLNAKFENYETCEFHNHAAHFNFSLFHFIKLHNNYIYYFNFSERNGKK